MNKCLLRFNAPTEEWRLQFYDGEILMAKQVNINCPCLTASRLEGVVLKFFIHIEYKSYIWSTDMTEITFN